MERDAGGEELNLFQLGKFTLHSGEESHFKIDCDALTDEDIECIAYLLARRVGLFSHVIGIPRGGLRLAKALDKYSEPYGPTVIVDDVLATGGSMDEMMMRHSYTAVKSAVIFARGPCPDWITPLFQMPEVK